MCVKGPQGRPRTCGAGRSAVAGSPLEAVFRAPAFAMGQYRRHTSSAAFVAAIVIAAVLPAGATTDGAGAPPDGQQRAGPSSSPAQRFVGEQDARRAGHSTSVASLLSEKDKTFVESVNLLRSHVLDGYSRLRPPENATAKLQLYLTQLVKVDTEKQSWTIGGWWRVAWQDQRLSWEESQWNVSFLSFAEDDIWRPDDTVHEAIQDMKSRDTPTMITVSPDGSASLSEPRVTTLSCNMRLASFPFDTQICRFTVGSSSFDRSQLDIVPRTIGDPTTWWREGENASAHKESAVDMVDFLPNTEFTIPQITITRQLKKFACCEREFSVLQYEFELQRSSLTYFTGTIVPLICIVVVSLIGLFLGARSFGRIYLGIVSILATTSIYRVASSQIPKSGEWTLIGKLYVYGFVNGFIVILVGMVVTSLALVFQLDEISETYLKEIFFRYDMSQSGSLDADEIREALHELGLNEEEITKCLMRLPFNQDGVLTMHEWLQITQLLTFDSYGDKARARHHNWLTGALLDWSLKVDREKTNKISWDRETMEKDLALLTSCDHASLTMKLFRELHVAGNYHELQRTREIMMYTDAEHDRHERAIVVQKAKLDQKLGIIARRLQRLTEKQSQERGAGLEAGTGSELKDIELMRQCLQKVLRGQFAPARNMAVNYGSTTTNVMLPALPKLEDLPHLDPDELQEFLEGLSGDLAVRAKFKKYASQIRKINIDGSTLRHFDESHLAELDDVSLGDRRPLLLGIRLLYRIYETNEQYMYQVEVHVMSAQHLPRMDRIGSTDAYVHVFLDDHKRGLRQDFASTAVRDSLNPTWRNQYAMFRVANLAEPGEMAIRLFDWDRLTMASSHELIGSHLFGEALLSCAVTSLRNCEGEVVWLSDLLNELTREHERSRQQAHADGNDGWKQESQVFKEVVLPLYHLGDPVLGVDGRMATVTLGLRLPQGTKRVMKMRLHAHEYPGSKFLMIFKDDVPADHTDDAVPLSSDVPPVSKPWAAQKSHARHLDALLDDEEEGFEKFLDSKSEVRVVKGSLRSEMTVKHDLTREAAKRAGIQLAAEIDYWSRIFLPFFFFAYLCLEVRIIVEHEEGSNFFEKYMKYPPGQSYARIVYMNNITDGPEAMCYSNTCSIKAIKSRWWCSDAPDAMPEEGGSFSTSFLMLVLGAVVILALPAKSALGVVWDVLMMAVDVLRGMRRKLTSRKNKDLQNAATVAVEERPDLVAKVCFVAAPHSRTLLGDECDMTKLNVAEQGEDGAC